MDYQEAIRIMKYEVKCACSRSNGLCETCKIDEKIGREKIIDACECAILAMIELNEYKEKLTEVYGEHAGMIETVVKNLAEYGRTFGSKSPIKARLLTNRDVDLWESYKRFGTMEEVREAVERQKEKKVADIRGNDKLKFCTCPSCGKRISNVEGGNYCQNCGQRLEW